VIRQDPNRLREQAARRLLRRIRDLNLGDGTVQLQDGQTVRITGCTSLDHPVERGVRYRISFSDGSTEFVELEWKDGRIFARRTREDRGELDREASFGLNGHPMGLVELAGLRSSIDLATASPEDFEEILSRIVEATVAVA